MRSKLFRQEFENVEGQAGGGEDGRVWFVLF